MSAKVKGPEKFCLGKCSLATTGEGTRGIGGLACRGLPGQGEGYASRSKGHCVASYLKCPT